MIYGYIRVSTDKQTVENQKFEINEYCKRNNLKIDGYIQETISGNKTYRKRELGKLLYKVQSDDLIICAELSRLGRNLFMIMEILNICMTKGCRVWTIKDNYKLGDDIQSKVLAFAFGLSAEIERNLISQRTKEALARIKSEGRTLGRRKGSKNRCSFCGRSEDEVGLLITGMSGYICDSCVMQAYEITQEAMRTNRKDGLRKLNLKELPKPMEIKAFLEAVPQIPSTTSSELKRLLSST